MPALVEDSSGQRQAKHNEQVHRVAKNLLEPPAQTVGGEQPVVHGQDAAGHGHDKGPVEQRPQQRSGGVRRTLGQQRAPRSQREQRVGRGRGGPGALGRDDAEREQFAGDEIANLVGVQ